MVMSVFGAAGVGFFAVLIIGKLFSMMGRIQSSGNVDIRNAIGQEGSVYLTIPAKGRGKVRVSVQKRMRIYDAVCEGANVIKSGESIEVVKVISGNVLVVKKLG